MRYKILILSLSLYCLGGAFAQEAPLKSFSRLPDGDILLEDFEQDSIGQLPEFWFNRDGKARPRFYDEDDREGYQYAIVQEAGNRFLRHDGVSAKHLNLPLRRSDLVDLNETPVLTWKWRAIELPAGASEDEKGANDTVLSVYVVFKTVGLFRMPQSIRYTWSSTLPGGTVLSKSGGRLRIVVLDSGSGRAGEWQTMARNLVEDYRKLFGKDPPSRPLALLILSDGNDTKQRAVGDYDEFVLRRE